MYLSRNTQLAIAKAIFKYVEGAPPVSFAYINCLLNRFIFCARIGSSGIPKTKEVLYFRIHYQDNESILKELFGKDHNISCVAGIYYNLVVSWDQEIESSILSILINVNQDPNVTRQYIYNTFFRYYIFYPRHIQGKFIISQFSTSEVESKLLEFASLLPSSVKDNSNCLPPITLDNILNGVYSATGDKKILFNKEKSEFYGHPLKLNSKEVHKRMSTFLSI